MPDPSPTFGSNEQKPTTPHAFWQAQNHKPVVNFGLWKKEDGSTELHPQDINPCGLLVRFGDCSNVNGTGIAAFTQQRTVCVLTLAENGGQPTLIAAANANRRFLGYRNIGPHLAIVGNENVVHPAPAGVGVTNGGWPLYPLEAENWNQTDRYTGPIYAFATETSTMFSVREG